MKMTSRTVGQLDELNLEFTNAVAAGVDALQAGQRRRARQLFGRIVRENPDNATAWLWLSRSVDDERQKQDCLDRIRQLDQARYALARDAPASGRDRDSSAARRKGRRALAGVLAAVIIVLACAATPLLKGQSAQAQDEPAVATNGQPLEASGVIRAQEVSIASEYGGRITLLPVREGEAVAGGDVLVQLDTALLDAQINAAQAAVVMTEAGLAQARAGARPGQIAVAEAQLAQVQAARVAAMQAVSDTMLLVHNPQDIQMQIAVLEQQIKSSQLEIDKALAIKDALEIGKNKFQDAQEKINDAGGPGKHRVPIPGAPPGVYYEYTVPSLPLDMHLVPNQWWQAWVGVNAAAASKEGLEASLANLYARQANPQNLRARVDQAIATLAQAEAQVLAARAQVDGLKAGATPEQIAALEAQVEQARAVLDTLLSQKARMEIVSPLDGVVVSLSAYQGEVAAPGATMVTLADLTQVKLTVYLAETQIGRISLGQMVRVTVDSFPGRAFAGMVTHIADRAEFTPRNVATQEERVNLVFAIEMSLDNEDGALKPGMPADAAFGNSK